MSEPGAQLVSILDLVGEVSRGADEVLPSPFDSQFEDIEIIDELSYESSMHFLAYMADT